MAHISLKSIQAALALATLLIAGAGAGKCCYSSPADCDDFKDFCSRDAESCASCSGTFYSDTTTAEAPPSEQGGDKKAVTEKPAAKNAEAEKEEARKAAAEKAAEKAAKAENKRDGFVVDLNDHQCQDLTQVAGIAGVQDCQKACSSQADCAVWQWCPDSGGYTCTPKQTCWLGAAANASGCTYQSNSGWISKAKVAQEASLTLASLNKPGGKTILLLLACLAAMGTFFVATQQLRRDVRSGGSRPLLEDVVY